MGGVGGPSAVIDQAEHRGGRGGAQSEEEEHQRQQEESEHHEGKRATSGEENGIELKHDGGHGMNEVVNGTRERGEADV